MSEIGHIGVPNPALFDLERTLQSIIFEVEHSHSRETGRELQANQTVVGDAIVTKVEVSHDRPDGGRLFIFCAGERGG